MRIISHKEIAERNSNDGKLWILLGQDVVDATGFQSHHPGGKLVLRQYLDGRDAIEAFQRAGHSRTAMDKMQKLIIGKLNEASEPPIETNHPRWREFVVFCINFLATAITFVSYWVLICDSGCSLFHFPQSREIKSLSELMETIFSTIYLPTQALLALGFVADYCLLKECRENVLRVQQAGFSLSYVLFCMSVIFFCSGPILGVIFWAMLQDSSPYFSYLLVVKVVLAYLSSDALFERVHAWMHRYHADWHLMHHCCQHPTVTSGLIFDLQDYSLEFWAAKFPILLAFGTPVLGLQDNFACVATMGVAILIDVCNHDAFCRTAHYRHHLDVSTAYGVLPVQMAPFRADRLDCVHTLLDDIFVELDPSSANGKH